MKWLKQYAAWHSVPWSFHDLLIFLQLLVKLTLFWKNKSSAQSDIMDESYLISNSENKSYSLMTMGIASCTEKRWKSGLRFISSFAWRTLCQNMFFFFFFFSLIMVKIDNKTSLVAQTVKVSAYNEGDPGSIPGSGRSPAEENGNPLQYFCLENPMDGGAW